MTVNVLASGSEGNCTLIQTENHKILFDLGMNLKYIRTHLEKLHISIYDIDYVFITHTHKDHTSAIETFINRHQPTFCLTETLFYQMPYLKEYSNIEFYDDTVVLEDVRVEAIKTSHDAPDARGFLVTTKEETLVFITDTGYINNKYFRKLSNKTYYLIESNHDIEKLMHGPYPPYLKKRILSDVGHLSNKACGFYLSKMLGPDTKKVLLMHLSEKNNSEELALETVAEVLSEYDISFNEISCAKQKELVEVSKNDKDNIAWQN